MPGQPETSSVDVLPWWSVPIILAAIGATILVGRAHPHTAPATIAIAWICTCEIADRWQGRRRMTAGAIASIALLYAFAITIQVHGTAIVGWIGGGVAMAAWTAWRIGGGAGTRTREVEKIAASLPNVMRASSPTFKDGTPVVKLGKVSADKFGNIQARYTVRDPEFKGDRYAALIAHDMTMAAGLVTDIDLSGTVAQGQHLLTVRAFAPFAANAPVMPDPDTWPKGKIPLGWDANSELVWLPMLDSDAQHMLIGGATGSGKSNFLRFLMLAYRSSAVGWSVWACDGSGGSLGMGAVCDVYYETDEDGVKLLNAALIEMKRREAEVTPGGMYGKPGDGILVVIDESASVLASKAAAFAAKEISARGRKARMAIVLGLQSAYVDAAGGGQTLANLPTRIAFRTAGEKYNRMIVVDNQPGYLSHEIARNNRGECIVRGMPHTDWERMRTWEVIDLPDQPTRTQGAPPAPAPPHVRSTQEECEGVQGAGAGAGAPLPDYTPENDPRPAKDRIRDLLSDFPRSPQWFADTVGCTRQVADRHLKTLENDGCARKRDGQGWVRRKAGVEVE